MVRGSPIRKSSDHSLVIDSPRLIADSYVLLRFLVPRHPPCALKNLTKSHKDKMLASTVQFSTNNRPPQAPAGNTPTRPASPGPQGTRHPPPHHKRETGSPIPQDPTACHPHTHPNRTSFPHPHQQAGAVLTSTTRPGRTRHPLMFHPEQPRAPHSGAPRGHRPTTSRWQAVEAP